MIEVLDHELHSSMVIMGTECRRKDLHYQYLGMTRADAIELAAALRKQGHGARAIPPRNDSGHYSVNCVKYGKWRTRKVKA